MNVIISWLTGNLAVCPTACSGFRSYEKKLHVIGPLKGYDPESHYSDVKMGTMASRITNLIIAYSTVYSGADQIKYQGFASLAFVRGINRWPVNSSHKWPVTRKMFPFDDVIMHLRFHGISMRSNCRLGSGNCATKWTHNGHQRLQQWQYSCVLHTTWTLKSVTRISIHWWWN